MPEITLIIPAAGKSTRFSGERPKYLRTMPNGDLMLVEAIKHLGIDNISRIIITVVKEHIEKSKVDLDLIGKRIFELKNIIPEFLILDDFTISQSETIYKTLITKNVIDGFIIKDCDNLFDFDILRDSTNYVCVSKLQSHTNAINKAYIKLDKYDNISGIIEKTVIGDIFCCGAYAFRNSETFIKVYEKVLTIKSIEINEIYISHIIQQMILDGELFKIQIVNRYVDLGTIDEWNNYTKQFQTLFIDIDGVLVVNGGEYFEPKWGKCDGLAQNIQAINKLYDSGKATIILTTARKLKYENETLNDLCTAGVKYHRIIFDLPHCQRILINDFNGPDMYPSAISININRNDNLLKNYLK